MAEYELTPEAELLKQFLSKATNLAPFAINGYFHIDDDDLLTAFSMFCKHPERKRNPMADFAQFYYLRDDCIDHDTLPGLDGLEYWDKEKRLEIRDLFRNSAWNYKYFLSRENLLKLGDIFSKNIWREKWEASRENRRKVACRYTARIDIRKAIFERDGKFCNRCFSTDKLHLDHILPVSKNGENTLENLQVLCRSCNSKKNNKIESLR